jgi:chemotaxis-related protein WspD
MIEPTNQSQRPLTNSIAGRASVPNDSRFDQNATQEPSDVAFAARTFFNREPPPHYLEEWIARLAQPEEQVKQDLLSLVIFRLHDELLAIQTSWLVEVTLPQPIHAIPHRTNEVVLGLVNIRGQLRICFSAHGLLGVALPARNEQTHRDDVKRSAAYVASLDRMLILHERSEQWVFPVEEVLGVHRLPMQELRPVPSTFGKAGAFSQSVFTWASRTVGYIDETRFLSALRSACK